jgi:hypothetical protein
MPTPVLEDRFTVEIGWNQNIDAYVARVPDIPELAAWDQTQEGALKKPPAFCYHASPEDRCRCFSTLSARPRFFLCTRPHSKALSPLPTNLILSGT